MHYVKKGSEKMAKSKNEIQKEYAKRSGYAAQKKYRATNTKKYSLECAISTEADIIEQLEAQPNKSGYITSLIRKEIENKKP